MPEEKLRANSFRASPKALDQNQRPAEQFLLCTFFKLVRETSCSGLRGELRGEGVECGIILSVISSTSISVAYVCEYLENAPSGSELRRSYFRNRFRTATPSDVNSSSIPRLRSWVGVNPPHHKHSLRPTHLFRLRSDSIRNYLTPETIEDNSFRGSLFVFFSREKDRTVADARVE